MGFLGGVADSGRERGVLRDCAVEEGGRCCGGEQEEGWEGFEFHVGECGECC